VQAPSSGSARRRANDGSALRFLGARLVELVDARELLVQLVRKELKVRYRGSVLGFLWTMLTPALVTVVFSVVFTRVVRIGVEDYAAFFVVGYLLWQFLQNSSQGSLHSIVGNAELVKKVYFPREVLPLSHVASQLIHLVLALLVVTPYLVHTRGLAVVVHLPGALVVLVLLAVFVAGVSLWFAATNVVLRDIQELFVVIFLVWFYASPVLYPLALARAELATSPVLSALLGLNPTSAFLEAFRAPLHGIIEVVDGVAVASAPTWPPLDALVPAFVWAVVVGALGWSSFARRARTFAREL
jgi:ABC-type polysaccharide/polyol phosphate export permease